MRSAHRIFPTSLGLSPRCSSATCLCCTRFPKALARIEAFDSQALANTSWSFATQMFCHEPLLAAISSRAIRHRFEFTSKHLVNTAWAYAHLTCRDTPLLDSISAAVSGKIQEFGPQ